jgi:PhoH-like ATPase
MTVGGARVSDANRRQRANNDPSVSKPVKMTYSVGDTIVLDTSVLLGDPRALGRFGPASVVLPVVVISELEGKRNHPDLGWAARQSLRALEAFRVEYGSLTEPIQVNDAGGTVRVELNHQDTSGLPPVFAYDSNDHRILAVAYNLAEEGHAVTVVTKDLPLRLKAAVVGLKATDGGAPGPDKHWTGVVEVNVGQRLIDELYDHRSVDVDDVPTDDVDLVVNDCVVLRNGKQSALARVGTDGMLRQVRREQELFGVRGRSCEQRFAMDLLSDNEVSIVSLGGAAGTGKSALALAAGLEAVLENKTHAKLMVFRPLFAVGGQDLGYLPGSESEKMGPWAAATHDVLQSISNQRVIEEIVDRGLLEVLPLTHIRGRSLSDAFVIIDEAQNLERPVLLTALSRLGNGCKVVLTHDVAQRDNLRVGRHDGVASVVDVLRGHPIFGHVTLRRSERGAIAALVTDLLDSAEQ